jgi:hypothetical protein
LNLGATCFRTEWRASATFRRLLLQDSPSSQPPRLPKFNLGTASPTRCTNYSVLQKFDFCSTLVHWIVNKFKSIFKLVDILSSGMETPCQVLCISLRWNAWDGQGPKLFESAQKFPRKVRKKEQYCKYNLNNVGQGPRGPGQRAEFPCRARQQGPRQQLKQPKHCSPQEL